MRQSCQILYIQVYFAFLNVLLFLLFIVCFGVVVGVFWGG